MTTYELIITFMLLIPFFIFFIFYWIHEFYDALKTKSYVYLLSLIYIAVFVILIIVSTFS